MDESEVQYEKYDNLTVSVLAWIVMDDNDEKIRINRCLTFSNLRIVCNWKVCTPWFHWNAIRFDSCESWTLGREYMSSDCSSWTEASNLLRRPQRGMLAFKQTNYFIKIGIAWFIMCFGLTGLIIQGDRTNYVNSCMLHIFAGLFEIHGWVFHPGIIRVFTFVTLAIDQNSGPMTLGIWYVSITESPLAECIFLFTERPH
jgi:hypothetical protein